MNRTAGADAIPEPLPPETAARLTAFARACKGAARAVVLYPAEHPTAGAALQAVAAAADAATATGPLVMAVSPDTLLVDGRQPAKTDMAVSELAALLHAHQIGQMVVEPQSDAELWRRFLTVLAVPPDQARLRGGLARLWSSEGHSRIEVRRIDFEQLLREQIRGDRATWDRIVAECLEGDHVALDDWTIDLIGEILEHPGRIGELLRVINERMPGDGTGGGEALAGVLQAVAQLVARTQPDALESVMSAIAEAAARLPVTTLGPMLKSSRTGRRPGLGRFVVDLVRRVQDGTIADMVATEVRGGRGTLPALADAFCGLAPDSRRRSAILTLARSSDAASPGTAGPDARAWESAEEYLLAYSDERFVSDAYDQELRGLAQRAADLDEDRTDPPDRVAAWTQSVDESAIRLLDAQMLVDMMTLHQDIRRWHDVAAIAVARIEMLLVVGDFACASFLVGALHHEAQHRDDPAIKSAALAVLDHLLTAATMRHVAMHLDTIDKNTVAGAKRFCHALGTSIVEPLAEVLSREERTRARQHLIDVLLGFGAPGRVAVERLKQSPNAAVRRTAVLLLREFGGTDALVDLQSLLNDAEPHVQRDAIRAIVMMRSEAAFQSMTDALVTGTAHTRSAITGVLSTLPHDDALPALAHLVRWAPCRGAMWQVYERSVQRLGAIGGSEAIDALIDVMNKRVVWAPFKIAVLRRLAVEAIDRIGTPDAIEALRVAAANGLRGARASARRRLAAREADAR